MSGMGLIFLQPARVGLLHTAVFQKQQPHFVGGHPADESFRFIEGGPEPRRDFLWVKRLAGHQGAPFGGRIVPYSAKARR